MGYQEGSEVRSTESAGAADAERARSERRHDVVMRLKRVEGQIRGVLAMIGEEAPCEAVAQQLAAARKALDRAFYEMMACDIEHAVSAAGADPAAVGRRIAEKTRLLAKYG